MPHLELTGISQAFRRPDGTLHRVLAECSFGIERGQFVSIVGPSGSGKTTLFNVIAGLAAPQSGSVTIGGTPVDGPSTRVSYMLQKDLLMPWRTTLENVTLGLEIRGVPLREARRRGTELLERYGLSGSENVYPSALSGGMRQRAALIRTLVLEPEIVLLDEPFSALDYQTRLMLEGDVRRIMGERGCTAILVTHDIDEAVSISDRVIVLGGKPASIKLDLSIELTIEGVRTPATAREAPEFRSYHKAVWEQLDVTLPGAA
ncbi:MAG TPA: ABC transporter ATP-binding protein [Candidatus Limnocylindria bacterium]|nr:ABC transporter ATP-binding protein [Candidatus Limnocylindria bacterium]